MEKIHGTNLGNWLVLEKWMKPDVFAGTDAKDETWLSRMLPAQELAAKLKQHRDTYITEEDFAFIAQNGLNMVRLPVTYGIFGDRPPLLGAIEYVDKALDWAEKYGLQLLLDLHTVPGSQNGYDNGGITGVCKWCKNPQEVEFSLTVLERLAQRYGHRPGLYGIEILNEPISWLVYVTAPSTRKAVDKQEAKGSGHVPLSFLKPFYQQAYTRLRKYLPVDKAIVFHDGFRLNSWGKFFRKSGFENVLLDTHIYIFAMETYLPISRPWVYKLFVQANRLLLLLAQRNVPVIVGEWCICNRYSHRVGKKPMSEAQHQQQQLQRYHQIADMELDAWNSAAGWFYWNYQLLRDRTLPVDQVWKEGWDLARCLQNGWLTRDAFLRRR